MLVVPILARLLAPYSDINPPWDAAQIASLQSELPWLWIASWGLLLSLLSILAILLIYYEHSRRELGKRENRFRLLAENSLDLICRYRFAPPRGFEYVSPAATVLTGYTPEEFYADPYLAMHIIHPEDRDNVGAHIRSGSVSGAPLAFRLLHKGTSGEPPVQWLELRATVICDAAGMPVAAEGIARDITERREAAEALRQRTAELALLSEAGRALSSTLELEAIYATIHDLIRKAMPCYSLFVSNYNPADQLIRCLYAREGEQTLAVGDLPLIPLEPEGRGTQSLVIRSGEPLLLPDYEAYMRTATTRFYVDEGGQAVQEIPSEGERPRSALIVPLKREGQVLGVMQVFSSKLNDYTPENLRLLEGMALHVAAAIDNAVLYQRVKGELAERQRIERVLRESEQRYRLLVEMSPSVVLLIQDDRVVYINPAGIGLLGVRSERDVLQMPVLDFIHPADRPTVASILERKRWGEQASIELRITNVRGETLVGEFRARNATYQGQPAILVIGHDVTDRQHLEEELRQSQKMEAVGRLAGGVAHDFNNLLTVINGYSELLLSEMDAADPRRFELSEVHAAAHRASALTRQLLAFSRRQVMEMRPLDLNEVIEGLTSMLARLIGEDISLQIELEPELGVVKADPGQIEQVVMNLAVNARDAMPGGGILVLRTTNVTLGEAEASAHPEVVPGPYVMLMVSDTGCGMSAEVQEHLFEPFFTTKGVGRGTGLGLPTVYGIVKQSGGQITCRSEPRRGTAFHIYLPRVDEAAPEEAPRAGVLRGGEETVLVVEDQDDVRGMAVALLRGLGYAVFEAPDGRAALQLLESQGGAVDLILTDMVMPEMSGRQLVETAAPLWPGIKVLYMSGYPDEIIAHQGGLEPGTHLIQKPFTLEILAGRVRETLDGE